MKKSILLLICVFGIVVISYSQVAIIPKFGFSLSNIFAEGDITPGNNYKVNFGLAAGGAFEIALTKRISLQPELLFVQKGWREKEIGGSNPYKARYILNYLEAPLLIKVKFGIFYINAGASLSMGVSGNYKSNYTYQNKVSIRKIKYGTIPDNYNGDNLYVGNQMDFGFQSGMGILVNEYIVMDFRYGLGLNNHNVYGGRFTNNCFMFTLGVRLEKERE